MLRNKLCCMVESMKATVSGIEVAERMQAALAGERSDIVGDMIDTRILALTKEYESFHLQRCAQLATGAPRAELQKVDTSSSVPAVLASMWFPKAEDLAVKEAAIADFLKRNSDMFIIAGGFPTALAYAGIGMDAPINDIDVFCTNADINNVRDVIVDFFIDEHVHFFVDEGAHSFASPIWRIRVDEYPEPPEIEINAVCVSARGIDDVLLSFDRTICQFGFDAQLGCIVATPAAKRLLEAPERSRSDTLDLVVGSGNATTCIRVGARDIKYFSALGVRVSAPSDVMPVIETIRRMVRGLTNAAEPHSCWVERASLLCECDDP